MVTPAGREALAAAKAAADLVRDHKDQARFYATERCLAVRRANTHGAPYRMIAGALDVSVGMVQQWMAAAKRQDPS